MLVKDSGKLEGHGACINARMFIERQNSRIDAWINCPHLSWLMWLIVCTRYENPLCAYMLFKFVSAYRHEPEERCNYGIAINNILADPSLCLHDKLVALRNIGEQIPIGSVWAEYHDVATDYVNLGYNSFLPHIIGRVSKKIPYATAFAMTKAIVPFNEVMAKFDALSHH